MRAARVAVTTCFALNGFLVGSFFSRLPAIQERLDLSEGELGLALLSLTITLMITQPLAGAAAVRIGSGPMAAGFGALASIAIAGPGFAESLLGLAAATAVIGAVTGGMDVSMNAQGVEVERRLGRPMFASLHAFFSIGMLVGAIVAGLVADAGTAPREHLAAVAAAGLVVIAVLRPALLPGHADASSGPVFATPSRRLAALGILAFCVLLAEGSVGDWSAVHLARDLDASEGLATVALSAFAVTMAVGRLVGDRVTARLGPVLHARLGGALGAAGFVLATAAQSVWLSVAGFALIGVGLSALFPLALRAAAQRTDVAAGPALAAVSTAGYTGLVTGPPLVGFLGEAVGLPLALGLVGGIVAVTAALLATAVR